jgi:hypothetical protein
VAVLGELEVKLNNILSSPEDMEKIAGLAKSLSGTFGAVPVAAASGTPEPEEAKSDGGQAGVLGGKDPKMLKLIGRLTGEYSSGGDKADLLRALRPYLKDERREKLDRAAEIARMARLAKIAFSEFGGGDGV